MQNNFVRNRLNAFAYLKNALAYASDNYRAWDEAVFPADMMAEMQRLTALLADGASVAQPVK
jgi:hypothetical protein